LANILIVDDHALMRQVVQRILVGNKTFKVVGEACTGAEALHQARQLEPELVLLDLELPGIGGIEVAQKLIAFDADIKIIVLTGLNNEFYPPRLFDIGVRAYLSKGVGEAELLHTLSSVQAGQRILSHSIAKQLSLSRVDSRPKSIFDELSHREVELLLILVRGKTPEEAAEILHLSKKTVNSYRYNMFAKLGVDNDVSLALLAIKYGLVKLDELGGSV
jgi:two-component system invasion response regulator UvrY